MNGSCFGSGENTEGQLAIGSTTDAQYTPATIAHISAGIAHISAGWFHSLFATADGRAFAAGGNHNGQLGIGGSSTAGVSVPTAVSNLAGVSVVQVEAGWLHSLFHEGEGEAGDEDPTPPQLDYNAELEWFTMQLVFHMLPLMETAVGSFKEKASKTHFSIDSTNGKEEFAKYLKNAFEADAVSDIAVGVYLKRREITTLLPVGVLTTQKGCDLLVRAPDNTSSTSVDLEAQNDRSSFKDEWRVFGTRGSDVELTCNPLHTAGFAGVTGGAGRSAGRSAVEQPTADMGCVHMVPAPPNSQVI
jgi:hypothetical protein